MPLDYQKLYKMIEILEQFQKHPISNFNFSKLAKHFKLDPKEGEELVDLLFCFQDLFHSKLNGYVLCKKRKNTTLYLKLRPKSKVRYSDKIELHEIDLNIAQSNLLSDIIYYFQHIQIGKGFDIRHNGSELIQKVKNLNMNHPYFFEHRGNGLIYPTKLALDLGIQILSYKRGNKPICELIFDNYLIKINSEGKRD